MIDIAERICALEGLPVVEEEIGDTWIYGAASDPEKISRYREIQRYIARNGCGAADLTGNALLVPEHTWGMAGQTFFPDTRHYSLTEFEGETKSGVPGEQRRAIEKSWEEQRGYVKEPEQLLDITPDYPVRKPPLDSYSPCPDRKASGNWKSAGSCLTGRTMSDTRKITFVLPTKTVNGHYGI